MPESVWDYPRPPALDPTDRRVTVGFAGERIADTTAAIRVLETSHPPTFYLPPGDVRTGLLRPAAGRSLCEWKGAAVYWDVVVPHADGTDSVAARAAWSYPTPTPRFAAIRDHLCFYASKMDACTVAGEPVRTQAGDFYGGWITPDVTGPFKGGPGTRGW